MNNYLSPSEKVVTKWIQHGQPYNVSNIKTNEVFCRETDNFLSNKYKSHHETFLYENRYVY